MATDSNNEPIRISLDDLRDVRTPETAVQGRAMPAGAAVGRSYGNISTSDDLVSQVEEGKGSVLLQGWFYLGLAGLLGSIVGWAICEPAFLDAEGMHRWGNTWMLPAIIASLCVSFGLAESMVERSTKKAALRTVLALPLGVVFGFFFEIFANIVYGIGLNIAVSLGAHDNHNPIVWIARGIGWVAFGVAGGLVYGIIGQSAKKAKYGILGGMLGAGIGGVVFDPISIALNGAALSRLVGFALFGLSTGAAMGIVESALKDRWLYVSAGPLAGKQFILYKKNTTLGSNQQCDIYLFKDQNILPDHAVLESRGNKVHLRANGPVYITGQPVQNRVLQDGDFLQIGRYGFRYKEKQKS